MVTVAQPQDNEGETLVSLDMRSEDAAVLREYADEAADTLGDLGPRAHNRRGPVSHQPSELPDADYDLEVDEDEMVFIGQGDEPPTDWAALAREQEEADRQNEIAEVADAPSTEPPATNPQPPMDVQREAAVDPAIAPVVKAFSRPDFVTFKQKQNEGTPEERSPLWKARQAAAKLLLRNALHAQDIDQFAVAFLPTDSGVEKFKLSTTGAQIGGRVLIQATSPPAAMAALRYFIYEVCHTDPKTAKTRGLMNPLPQLSAPVEALRMEVSPGTFEWVVLKAEEASMNSSAEPIARPPASRAAVAQARPVPPAVERLHGASVRSNASATAPAERPSRVRFATAEEPPTQDDRRPDIGRLRNDSVKSAGPPSNQTSRVRFAAEPPTEIPRAPATALEEDAIEPQESLASARPSQARRDDYISIGNPPPPPPQEEAVPVVSSSAVRDLTQGVQDLKTDRDGLLNDLSRLQSKIQEDWHQLREQQNELKSLAESRKAQLDEETRKMEADARRYREETERSRVELASAKETAEAEAARRAALAAEELRLAAEIKGQREDAERVRKSIAQLARIREAEAAALKEAKAEEELVMLQAQDTRNSQHEVELKLSATRISVEREAAARRREAERVQERLDELSTMVRDEDVRLHRLRLAEQEAGATLATVRADQLEIQRRTAELLQARLDEQAELRQYKAALQSAASTEVDRQREALAEMRASVLAQSEAAERSKADLRATEEALAADQARSEEESVRLRLDRALLNAQTERQREAAARYEEEQRLLDLEEATLAEEAASVKARRDEVTAAYSQLRSEQEALVSDFERLKLTEAEVVEAHNRTVAEAESVRERMFLEQRASLLAEKRRQVDAQRELLGLEQSALSEIGSTLEQQAEATHRLAVEKNEAKRRERAIERLRQEGAIQAAVHASATAMDSTSAPPPPSLHTQRYHEPVALTPASAVDEFPWLKPKLMTEAARQPQQRGRNVIVRKARRDGSNRQYIPASRTYAATQPVYHARNVRQSSSLPPVDPHSETSARFVEVEMERLLVASTYIAQFDYSAESPDELSFRKGDKILLLEKNEAYWRDDPEWLKGMAHGCTGYFPANRVAPAHGPFVPNQGLPVNDTTDNSVDDNVIVADVENDTLDTSDVVPTVSVVVEEEAVNIIDFERLSDEELEALSPAELKLYREREALVETQKILVSQQEFARAERAAAIASLAALEKHQALLALQRQNPDAKVTLHPESPTPDDSDGGGPADDGSSSATSYHDESWQPVRMNDRDLIALGVSPDTAQSGGSRRVRKRTSEHEISPTGEAASGGARRQRNSFFGRSKPQNIQHEGGQRRARSFFFRRSNSDDSDYADELDAENDRDNQQEDFDPTPDDVSTMFGDDVSRMTAGANPDYPAAGFEGIITEEHQVFDGTTGNEEDGEGNLRNLALAKGGSNLQAMQDAETELYFKVIRDFLAFKRAERENQKFVALADESRWHGGLADLVRFCGRSIYVHPWFEPLIFLVILANIITLAMYNPRSGEREGDNWTLNLLEISFLGVYWLELLVKVSALGFIYRQSQSAPAYLFDHWNRMDFVIVIVGTVEASAFVANVNFGMSIAALRAFRVLRVVRAAEIVPQLRLVVHTLYYSMPSLTAVTVLLIAYLLLFVTVGLSIFGGDLDTGCFAADVNGTLTQVGVRACGGPHNAYRCAANEVCLSAGNLPVGVTLERPFDGVYGFDNAGIGLYTVLTIVLLEGWSPILFALNDAGGGAYNWIFFVLLIGFGTFVLLNLFAGIVAVEYAKRKEHDRRDKKLQRMEEYGESGNKLVLLEDRNQWSRDPIKSQNVDRKMSSRPKRLRRRDSTMYADQPHLGSGFQGTGDLPPDPSDFKYFSPEAAALIKSRAFIAFISITILTNAVFLGLDKHPEENDWHDTLRIGNYVFVGIFTVEMLIKFYAYGFQGYFKRQLNRLDFVIVATSIAELVVVEGYGQNSTGVLSAFKVFRLLRIFKLMTFWRKFRELFFGLVAALMHTRALVATIALFLLVTSLLGKGLFGRTFSSRTNFDDFPNAFITTFQLFTSEEWPQVYREGIVGSGGADSDGATAGIFFVGVVFIGSVILVALFLAISISDLTEEKQKEVQASARRLRRRLSTVNKLPPPVIENEDTSMVPHYSLFVFSPTNPIRVLCHTVIVSPLFQHFILACILASSAVLGAYDYRDRDATRNRILDPLEIAFVSIFSFEAVLKIIALGFVAHPRAYLRSGWNVLDFIVVVASILAYALRDTVGDDLQVVRVLLALRILRAVRFVKFSHNLRKTAHSIVASVREIGGLLFVGLLVIYCFAVLGVSLFKGQFGYCESDISLSRDGCTDWRTPYLNFNNVLKGCEALLAIATMEGWVGVYHDSADANGIDQAPSLNANQWSFLFYLVYITIISLFFMQLILAFVVVTYQRISHSLTERCGLTPLGYKCLVYAVHAKVPTDPLAPQRHTKTFKFLTSRKFEVAILVLIGLNVVELLMHHHRQSEEWTDALFWSNVAFVTLFTLEAFAKLATFGVLGYFHSNWNRFDFAVVVAGLTELAVDGGGVVLALRILRAVRMVRVFRFSKLRRLLLALVDALVSIAYLFGLLVLVMYIYAVIGMQLFARLPQQHGTPINEYINFATIENAFFTLFVVLTNEGWVTLMESCLQTPTGCRDAAGGSTCGSELSPLYFLSFVFICSIFLLSIFAAIIVDNVDLFATDESEITPYHLQDFIDEWAKVDPRGRGRIHFKALAGILRRLPPPFGVGDQSSVDTLDQFMARLPIGIAKDGTVAFKSTLLAILRVRLDLWIRSPQHEFDTALERLVPSATKLEIYECCAALTNESVAELRLLYSVKLIQVRWRQLRKDRVLFARLRELEERISTLRAAHEISSSQLGPGASAEQIAARDVSVRHLQGLMVEATALRRHLTPHDRLADLLAREYALHRQKLAKRQKIGQKKGKAKLDQPLPIQGARGKQSTTVTNPAFQQPQHRAVHSQPPRQPRGPPPPRHAEAPAPPRFAHLRQALRPSGQEWREVLAKNPPPPPPPSTAVYPPGQEWRALLQNGQVRSTDVYRGPPPVRTLPATFVAGASVPPPPRPERPLADPEALRKLAMHRHAEMLRRPRQRGYTDPHPTPYPGHRGYNDPHPAPNPEYRQ